MLGSRSAPHLSGGGRDTDQEAAAVGDVETRASAAVHRGRERRVQRLEEQQREGKAEGSTIRANSLFSVRSARCCAYTPQPARISGHRGFQGEPGAGGS